MLSTPPRRRPPGARFATALAAAALLALLTACAGLSPDGGFAAVEQTAQTRLGKDLRWARSEADMQPIANRVAALLARPLGADDAVQLALLNNRGLQASLQDLAIADAERVQAGRLPNPGFSFGRLSRGDERELERGLHVNLARLLAWPLIDPLEARRFQQTQGRVAADVLALAADTRKAYFTAVAAEQTLRLMLQAQQAAEASAELARRMEQAGNFSKLRRVREQVLRADATLRVAQAQQVRLSSRERLTRLLGLSDAQGPVVLPDTLPELPAAPADEPGPPATVLAQRLDVQGARLAAEQTASNLGLTRTTRFVNVLELGLLHNRSNEAPTQRGWELALELPLFDWGDARVARAEAVYMQTVHRAAQIAVNAQSELREAYGAYRTAYAIARQQRDEIVPLAQLIGEENVLRYNGMLVSVFELLADARQQTASVNGSILALRDFWIAQVDLDMALIGKPGLAMAADPAATAVFGASASAGH